MDFLYTQMMSRNDGVYEITILNSRKQALEDWGITKQSYMRHLREMGEDESVAVTYVNEYLQTVNYNPLLVLNMLWKQDCLQMDY